MIPGHNWSETHNMYHIKFSIYIIQYYIHVDKKNTNTVNCSLLPVTM